MVKHSRAKKHIRAGDRFRDAKEWTAAIKAYQVALEIEPNHANIWTQLGHCLKESEQFSEAESAYRQAASLSADEDALLHLAHMLKVQGRIDDALAEFEALEQVGKFEVTTEIQALREARNALSVRWIEAADNERDDQHWAKAAELYKTALDYAPELAHIWVQYGHCLKENQDYDAALAAYTRASSLAPSDPDPILHLAHLLKQCGKTDEALRAFRMLDTLQPGQSQVLDEIVFLSNELACIEADAPSTTAEPSSQSVSIEVSCSNETDPDSQYSYQLVQLDQHGISGWIEDKAIDSRNIAIEIFVNGVFYADVNAHGQKRKTFKLKFPRELFSKDNINLTIILPDKTVAASARFESAISTWRHFSHLSVNTERRISVIVPIYNAADDVVACLSRLIPHTTAPARLILIDDASTDPKIAYVLSRCALFSNIEVLHNEHNLGYTKTINIGITHAGDDDVVLLNSDAKVTPRWLDGLRCAVAANERIGTVTPMSDRAGAFSAPSMGNDNPLPAGWDEEGYAKAFRRNSAALFPEVPTGNGFCMYIRRKLIDEIGSFDEEAFPRGYGEENDFCMRAARRGWTHVIDDRTYVFHERSKSFGDERTELLRQGRTVIDQRYPEYAKLIPLFKTSPLLTLARFRARQLTELAPAQVQRMRALFVISTRSGGTPHTNNDLMCALANHWECWLLICDTKTLTLSRMEDEGWKVVSHHELQDPVDPVTYHSADYETVVADWLELHAFDIVHIRHLGWHSLALPRLASVAGAGVVMSFHDFHVVCPNIKLIDNFGNYCGGTCTSTTGDCEIELWPQNCMPHVKNKWVYYWRERYAQALSYCDAFVTTSQSARLTIMKNVPDLPEKRFQVVPHGRDFEVFISPPLTNEHLDRSFRILVPGNISKAKGRDIISALLEEDKDGRLEFHILGNHSFTDPHPRLIFHGPYNREDFAMHVEQINPDVGAVFSIWDETWCHTLTELWAAGLPAMVGNFPTLATRVQESGAGWVYDPIDGKALYTSIINDLSDPIGMAQKRNAVRHWQAHAGAENTTALMASRYQEIYRQAIKRRRALTRAFPLEHDANLDME